MTVRMVRGRFAYQLFLRFIYRQGHDTVVSLFSMISIRLSDSPLSLSRLFYDATFPSRTRVDKAQSHARSRCDYFRLINELLFAEYMIRYHLCLDVSKIKLWIKVYVKKRFTVELNFIFLLFSYFCNKIIFAPIWSVFFSSIIPTNPTTYRSRNAVKKKMSNMVEINYINKILAFIKWLIYGIICRCLEIESINSPHTMFSTMLSRALFSPTNYKCNAIR
jgi:hypothetical protein